MVSQRLPPHRNAGAERQALLLARALRDHGASVSFLTTRFRRGLPSRESVDGFTVERLPTITGALLKPTQFFGTAVSISRKAQAFDVIHGHCLSASCLGAVLGAVQRRKPILLKPSTRPPRGEIAKLEGSIVRPIWRHLARRVSGWAVLSQDIERELEEVGVESGRCYLVDNGVDTRSFCPRSQAERADLRGELGLPAGPGVLFAGQLIDRKGIQELLEAWPVVRTHCQDAWLAIAGSGSMSHHVARAEKMFNGSLFHCGEVKEIAPWYQAADVFVLPTKQEGQSNAVLEALASGLPVVTGPAGATHCASDVDDAFEIVDPRNPNQIAKALVHLIDNESERRRRGSVAHCAAAKFSIANIAAQYISIYQRIIGQ
jgi:glycosyltransferase involved in cell wall biosynthesis